MDDQLDILCELPLVRQLLCDEIGPQSAFGDGRVSQRLVIRFDGRTVGFEKTVFGRKNIPGIVMALAVRTRLAEQR